MKVTQDNNIEECMDLTLWSVIGNIGIGRYCFWWSVIGPKNPDRNISTFVCIRFVLIWTGLNVMIETELQMLPFIRNQV